MDENKSFEQKNGGQFETNLVRGTGIINSQK